MPVEHVKSMGGRVQCMHNIVTVIECILSCNPACCGVGGSMKTFCNIGLVHSTV